MAISLGCWLGAGARGGTGPKVRADKTISANRLAGIGYTITGSPAPNVTLPRPEPIWPPSPRTTPSAKLLWSKPREELRQERDEAIRTAYSQGLPMKAIAQVMHMSHQRVSQIVRR